MRKFIYFIVAFLVMILGWTGYQAWHNIAIEKIPARDRVVKLQNNMGPALGRDTSTRSSKVLHALENGQPYPGEIFDNVARYTAKRYDTSDFRLQSLARILYEHSDRISAAERKKIKDIFLGFKYWMDQPGEDSMCYWSENHQLMFATSEYLAGQYWSDELFTNSGLTGREHRAMGRGRILTWLEQRWLYGFTEWYSNTYYVEDIAPLSNLIDFAEDEDIVAKATMILDLLLHDVATQSFKGTFISSSGRMYANGKRYGETNAMQAVIDHVWGPARWGQAPSERIGMDLNFVYINNYQVPPVIKAIGEDDQREIVIRASTGLNLDELAAEGLIGLEDPQIMMQLAMEAFSNDIVIENTVAYVDRHNMFSNEFLHDLRYFNLDILKRTGALPLLSRRLNPVTNGVAIQRANTYTYKTPDYMLASAQAYHPGTFGDQQHLWNATLSRTVSVFTTHPAKALASEGALSGSPGYWVGSGRFPHVVQDRNVVLNIFQPPAGKGYMEKAIQDYTHAHFPRERFDEVIIDGRYAFGRTGKTYAALIARVPLHYAPGTTDDLVQPGLDSYWVFEAGSAASDGDFASFVARIKSNGIGFQDGRLSYTSNGRRFDLTFRGDFLLDGVRQDLEYPRFASPYAQVERKPRIIRIEHAGQSLELDFYGLQRTIN